MKNNIKFLFFAIILMLGLTFNVNALNDSEIKITNEASNTKASFNKNYSSLTDAENDVAYFKKFVTKNNGLVLSTDIKKTIDNINNTILKSVINVDDISKIDDEINSIKEYYKALATSDKNYDVVLGNLDTVLKITKTIEYTNGVIGEFETEDEAKSAIKKAEENNTEDFVLEGSYEKQHKLVSTDIILLDKMFNTRLDANIYLASYALRGYDVSNSSIKDETVSNISTEIKTFNSLIDIEAYKKLLEIQGYDVQSKLKGFKVNTVESDKTEIDETFYSLSDKAKYLLDLAKHYNNIKVDIKNESYNNIIDDTVSETFNTEQEANDYLDSLKNEYRVTNDSITKNEGITRTEEDITKYFTSYDEANIYLNNLQKDFTLENSTIVRLENGPLNAVEINTIGDAFINSENIKYNYLGIQYPTSSHLKASSINLIDDAGNSSKMGAEYKIESATINGESVNLNNNITNIEISNNDYISINYSVKYCTSYNRWGMCQNENTSSFNISGYINKDLNNATFEESVYRLNLSDISVDQNGKVSVNPNLMNIYKLNTTKVIINTNPTYTVTADIYKFERIHKYRVVGTVSNISLVPEYKVEFTKTKNSIKYHLVGIAKKDIYKDVFKASYNAKRITEISEINYSQHYSVIETKYVTTYNANGIGVLYLNGIGSGIDDNNVINETVPNTGIHDINYGLIIFILLGLFISTNIIYFLVKIVNSQKGNR